MKYSVSYAKKVLAFIKAALLFAFNRKHIDSLYGQEYRIKKKSNSTIVYLDEWEVNKIFKHQFLDNLQRHADAFLIQCYTGLAYAELKRLSKDHL